MYDDGRQLAAALKTLTTRVDLLDVLTRDQEESQTEYELRLAALEAGNVIRLEAAYLDAYAAWLRLDPLAKQQYPRPQRPVALDRGPQE